VYAWFGSHFSPVPGPPRNRGGPSMADGSHFEPLMSCPLAVQPVLYVAGVHLAADAERASKARRRTASR
jgi:hypothetical protein